MTGLARAREHYRQADEARQAAARRAMQLFGVYESALKAGRVGARQLYRDWVRAEREALAAVRKWEAATLRLRDAGGVPPGFAPWVADYWAERARKGNEH